MTGDAILGRGVDAGRSRGRDTQESSPVGVVFGMAGGAGIYRNSGIGTDIGTSSDLLGRHGVNAAAPATQGIRLSRKHARRIMTGKAHLAAGAVTHQKILRDPVDALNMRIVARGALDISVDQFHRSGRIGGGSLCGEIDREVRGSFDRQHEAEGMGAAQICADDIHIVHRAGNRNLTVGGGLSNRDSAVVAAETETAALAEDGLRATSLLIGRARIRRVGLGRKSLVPERRNATETAMWCMTEGAAEATLRADRRAARYAQIVLAKGVGLDRRGGCLRVQQGRLRNERDTDQQEEAFHGLLPPAAPMP